MLLASLSACNDKQNDGVSNYEEMSQYSIMEDALKEDLNSSFDRLMYYYFTPKNPSRLILVAVDAADKTSETEDVEGTEGATPQHEYKYFAYNLSQEDAELLYGARYYLDQSYPFKSSQLDALSYIIEKYDPDKALPEECLTEDFKPKIDELVDEYCK